MFLKKSNASIRSCLISDKIPLVIDPNTDNVPILLNKIGEGNIVQGQVYAVDEAAIQGMAQNLLKYEVTKIFNQQLALKQVGQG